MGESDRKGEASVTVTGLNPDHIYNVRVIAVNQHNFQAPGELMRLRTRRSNAEDRETIGYSPARRQDQDDTPPVPSLSTEPASPLPKSRKERKFLKDRDTIDAQISSNESATNEKKVEALTRELNVLRQEINEATSQLLQIEEEHKIVEAAHIEELEAVKKKKKEEESARNQTRTEITALNKMKLQAEAARTKKANELKAKEAEIVDLQDDIQRWEDDRATTMLRLESLQKNACEADEKAAALEEASRKTIEEQQAAITTLEEEIRELVTSIKSTEAHDPAENDGVSGNDMALVPTGVDREWEQRRKMLHQRYIRAGNAFKAAEDEFFRSIDAVNSWHSAARSSLSGSTPTAYDFQPGMHGQPMPAKKTKHRRNRNRKSRSQTVSNSSQSQLSPEAHAFPDGQVGEQSAFASSARQNQIMPLTPGDPLTPANFRSGNIALDFSGMDDMPFDAPMSPSASALLPTDLFSSHDQDDVLLSRPSNRNSYADSGNYPQSPLSSGSQAASLVSDSSPRGSFQHMPLFPSVPVTLAQATPSASTPLSQVENAATPATKNKFANLFSFKPRPKVNEPPALGTLKSSESRSFPRENNGFASSLAPIGTGRQRSGSGTSWQQGSAQEARRGPSRGEGSNSNFFNPFNPKYDPLEQSKILDPVSPRPSSIASFDVSSFVDAPMDSQNQLPLPSSQVSAAFGWQPYDSSAYPNPNRGLSMFNSPWGSFSANASVTSFSTNNAISTAMDNRWPHSRPITPRLNPIAPIFTSTKIPSTAATAPPSYPPALAITGPNGVSQDSFSIHTGGSSVPSTAGSSLGPSADGSAPKESSLLSRLSKTSAPKFNIGSWKLGRKKDTSSLAGNSETGDETDFEPLPQPPTSAPAVGRSMSLFRKKDTTQSDITDDAEKERDKDAPLETPGSSSSKWGISLYRKKDHSTPTIDAKLSNSLENEPSTDPKSAVSEPSTALIPTKNSAPRFSLAMPTMGRKDRDKEKDKEKEEREKVSKELAKRAKEEEKERKKEKKEKERREKKGKGKLKMEKSESMGSMGTDEGESGLENSMSGMSASVTGGSLRELSSVPE